MIYTTTTTYLVECNATSGVWGGVECTLTLALPHGGREAVSKGPSAQGIGFLVSSRSICTIINRGVASYF